ncbi:MAG: hypothetical protein KBA26_06270 [Candidatus Delongbacteria bacterium]|nr:hypothetical protein [Candidatus Delongbacteria bacterium]
MNSLKTVLVVMLLSFIGPMNAQQKIFRQWMVGTELDVIPFVFDGYYASLIGGYEHWRSRMVLSHLTTPDFVTPSGFKDNVLDVKALIVDYYPQKGFHGWWIGSGFEIWDGNVKQTSSGHKKDYQTSIFTLGSGYTYYFYRWLYINPWVAIHIPIAGDRKIKFNDDTYSVKTSSEASLKLGCSF